VTYVPKSTRHAPLLTPSRPNSYQEAIALRTGLGTAAKTQNSADKNPRETDDKNRIKRQLKTSPAFHQAHCERVQGTTMREQFRLEKLFLIRRLKNTTETSSCNNSHQKLKNSHQQEARLCARSCHRTEEKERKLEFSARASSLALWPLPESKSNGKTLPGCADYGAERENEK
jgi:hypothetical protein